MPWTLSAFIDEAGPSSDDQVAAAGNGGLSHIDLRSVDGHNIVELPVDAAKTVKKKLDDAGISVHMYGSPIGKIDIADDLQKDLDRLDHLAKMRDVFGCDAVRMFSYFNKHEAPKEQWKDQSLDRLRRLMERAEQLDLVLYHENESDIFGDHPEDVLAIAEIADGKRLKLIYDFANYIRTGMDGMATWAMFKNKTDCFHFKDQKKSGDHVPMGQGDTDAQRILADAASAGWEGACVLEPHLSMSDAVLATGVSGQGDRSLKAMGPAESFQVAVDAAKALLDQIGVAYH